MFARLLLLGVYAIVETQARTPIEPNHESARNNAFHIFNAIHSAGR